jgi:uncharacterized repeat protein (TIGR01451 family)/uncharacterized delta-60 repeat protein
MNYKKKTFFKKKVNTIKYLVLLAIFLLPLLSISQIKPYGEFEPSKGDPARPRLPALCPVVNGINVTTTGTTPTPYFAPTLPNPCLPSAAYAGLGRWTDAVPDGFITYTFSQPLTSAVISYSVVNGDVFGNGQDVGAITTNSSGTTTLSNPCGLNINGNVISPNYLLDYSDVRIQVSSNCPFTTITLVNVGGQSGWVQGNPCNFILTPAINCVTYSPLLSQTSLSNVCPNTTVSLSSITASNNPNNCNSNFSLTWHTSATATATNILNSINNVVAGTYYASFYNSIANCYSPTTPVVVTINGCTTDIRIIKTINNPTPSVGSNVTFTINVTNVGPGGATNVVINDFLPSGYTFISATPSVGTWSAPNWTINNFANGANATLNIVATVKPTGNYKNTATVTANQTDPVPSNNTSSVTPTVLYAAPDNFTATAISTCTGGITASVLNNDTLNGTLVTTSQVVASLVNAGGLTGVVMNGQGIITVSSGNLPGNYTITYRICQTASGFTNNCVQGTALVKIVAIPLIAINDNFSAPINTLTGGDTPTVLTNDSLNGVSLDGTTLPISITSVTPTIFPTPTISNGGVITIPPGTTVGTYTITYKIAQNGCPSNFATATATINVTEQTIITPVITPGIRANSIVSHIETQSTGKIIIGGYFSAYNNVAKFNITRLNTDLTLDTSSPQFVSTGSIPAGSTPFDMKIVRNTGVNYNKILLVGMFEGFNGASNGKGIVRLNVNGDVDPTFNFGQLATQTSVRGVTGKNSTIYTCYTIPDGLPNAGKILIGGSFLAYNGYPANSIALLNADGTFDLASPFNTNVNTIIDPLPIQSAKGFDSAPVAFEVQPNGQIIVAGYFRWYNGLNKKGILRLNSNGTHDATFNNAFTGINDGFLCTPYVKNGVQVSKLVVQPDGKIIVGGFFTHYNNTSRNNIVRLNSDGSLDTTFNVGTGFNNNVVHPVTGTNGLVRSLALDTTNSNFWYVYVAGDFTAYNGAACNEIVRLFCKSPTASNVGTKDGGFNLLGGGTNGTVWSIKRQGDILNKLIIGGQFTTYNGLSALNVTRILPALASGEAKNGTTYYDSEPEIDIFDIDDVVLYPNPSTGIIYFKTDAFEDNSFSIKVYNSLGQKVFETEHTDAKDTSLDLSDLKKGIYFVSFISETKTVTKTVILQ